MAPVEYAPSLRNTASEPIGRVGSIDLPATATNVTYPVRERIAAEVESRNSAADRREWPAPSGRGKNVGFGPPHRRQPAYGIT